MVSRNRFDLIDRNGSAERAEHSNYGDFQESQVCEIL
jgi:hypothetical protein